MFPQVKLELARELHLLLAGGGEARSRATSMSDESCCYDETSRSERMDMDDSNIIIPLSMVALVEYASSVTTTGAGLTSQLASTLPNWMTRGVTPFRIKCRPLQPSAVVDSSDYECPLCMQLMVTMIQHIFFTCAIVGFGRTFSSNGASYETNTKHLT